MSKVMKRLLGIAARVAGVFTLSCIAYVALLAHPEPLFAHVVTYSNLTFYSAAPLAASVADLATAVDQRLATSELFHPNFRQRVFVVDRPWLWNVLNGPYRRVMARNVEIANPIFIPTLDVAHRRVRHFDGGSADAVTILTHETVHTLVEQHIGLLRLWRLPWWKKEGYAEYIASQRATASEAPPRYQSAARRWKYLLENEHLSFDQVMQMSSDTLPPEPSPPRTPPD